ncbi:hypothetical protein TRFO_13426 [Tritrichomonas foetus]|uniref:Uncharacterized protein n=1 Tax=Tritrichomonas foetus TaxID=1144522 RepID=A0A1J4KY61_9EUKA|nr:hypothetical protein TRFO_13426 [Tritrichomonas foetus]|eukprot:OHT16106.1 hypothetical protein TRFO_13426 [Tritrichomonas foetus]
MDAERLQIILNYYVQNLENPNIDTNQILQVIISEVQNNVEHFTNLIVSFILDSSKMPTQKSLLCFVIKNFKLLLPNNLFLQLFNLSLNSDKSFQNHLCDAIGSVILPEQVILLINVLSENAEQMIASNHIVTNLIPFPALEILLIFSEKQYKLCNELKITDCKIQPFILNFLFNFCFNENNKDINIWTIAATILSYYNIENNPDFMGKICVLFDIPFQIESFHFFDKLFTSFNDVDDSHMKFAICLKKIEELANFVPFPSIPHNFMNEESSLESFAFKLIELMSFADNLDDFEYDKDLYIKKMITLCLLPEDKRQEWHNDIESFLVENFDDESNDQSLRQIIFLEVSSNWVFSAFYNFCSSSPIFIQDKNYQETFYYLFFNYAKDLNDISNFSIPPPIDENDEILMGQFIRCITVCGIRLDESVYRKILESDSHILKIFLAYSVSEVPSKFPDLCNACLYSMTFYLDSFSTGVILSFFEIIGHLILGSHLEINTFSSLLSTFLVNWTKSVHNFNISSGLSSLISDFTKDLHLLPCIQSMVLPIVSDYLKLSSTYYEALILCNTVTKCLPCNSVEVSNLLTHDIFSTFINILNVYLNNEEMNSSQEAILGLASFYCRINQVHPLMPLLIKKSISSNIPLHCHFVSFFYEYLLNQPSDQNPITTIAETLREVISLFITTSKLNKQEAILDSLALFYTESPEYANYLFNYAGFPFHLIYQFIFENSGNFSKDVIRLFCMMISMSFQCVEFPQNFTMSAIELFREISARKDLENDRSYMINQDDPFIIHHRLYHATNAEFKELCGIT